MAKMTRKQAVGAALERAGYYYCIEIPDNPKVRSKGDVYLVEAYVVVDKD
jgi:hypothetical protein